MTHGRSTGLSSAKSQPVLCTTQFLMIMTGARTSREGAQSIEQAELMSMHPVRTNLLHQRQSPLINTFAHWHEQATTRSAIAQQWYARFFSRN